VTVQGHERGRVRLGYNDYLQGEKEIRKESSDLRYLYNIHKVRLFIKYESHMIVPSSKGSSSSSSTGSTNSLTSSRPTMAKCGSHPVLFNHGLGFLASSVSLIWRFSSSSALTNARCISCFAASNWLFRDANRGVGRGSVSTG
jgi:hypothetical protein